MAQALIPAIQGMLDQQTETLRKELDQLEVGLDQKLKLAKLQLGLLTLSAIAGTALLRYITG